MSLGKTGNVYFSRRGENYITVSGCFFLIVTVPFFFFMFVRFFLFLFVLITSYGALFSHFSKKKNVAPREVIVIY